jgi:hypothetical protein
VDALARREFALLVLVFYPLRPTALQGFAFLLEEEFQFVVHTVVSWE